MRNDVSPMARMKGASPPWWMSEPFSIIHRAVASRVSLGVTRHVATRVSGRSLLSPSVARWSSGWCVMRCLNCSRSSASMASLSCSARSGFSGSSRAGSSEWVDMTTFFPKILPTAGPKTTMRSGRRKVTAPSVCPVGNRARTEMMSGFKVMVNYPHPMQSLWRLAPAELRCGKRFNPGPAGRSRAGARVDRRPARTS
jgi:hypothetical protein